MTSWPSESNVAAALATPAASWLAQASVIRPASCDSVSWSTGSARLGDCCRASPPRGACAPRARAPQPHPLVDIGPRLIELVADQPLLIGGKFRLAEQALDEVPGNILRRRAASRGRGAGRGGR